MSDPNPFAEVMRQVRIDQDGQIFRALVDTIDGVEVGIIYPVQGTNVGRTVPALDGLAATLSQGDEVLVVRLGRVGLVVVGKIVRN